MDAAIMVSIEINGRIGSDLIQCSAADAATLRDALATCPGLMPGEVAQRLAAILGAFQAAKVTHIDTTIFPPPPAEMDMTPRADDTPAPILKRGPAPLPRAKRSARH